MSEFTQKIARAAVCTAASFVAGKVFDSAAKKLIKIAK